MLLRSYPYPPPLLLPQVRYLPYMSPSEFDLVLRRHVESSYTSPVHARLRATLDQIELRGRKKTRRNQLFNGGEEREERIKGREGKRRGEKGRVCLA